jgi:predicted nucleic acid-binding protein
LSTCATNRPLGQKQAIKRLLRENKDKKNRIFTSAITHLEALPKKLNKNDVAKEAEYMSMFGSMYFFDIAVDGQVIQLAREIKDFYFVEGDPKAGLSYQMMSTGDAVHLATAIINQATEFHTRDKNTRGGNVKLIGLTCPDSSDHG